MASQYSTPNAADMERDERHPLLHRTTGRPNHMHLHGICDNVKPISASEFVERQRNLSSVLLEHKAEAYIAEPGANMLHLTNIRWSLSERPFLLVIQAKKDKANQVLTRTTIVAPAFEATRARQKIFPGASIEIKTWEEAESAYAAVKQVLDTPWVGSDDDHDGDDNNNKPYARQVFLDPDMRNFIAQGLTHMLTSSSGSSDTATSKEANMAVASSPSSSTWVSMAPKAISLLRERKTAHEIEILRCVAQATVRVIQTVRGEIKLGMRESQVQALVTRAYRPSGLTYEHGESLVLFGANAALPHGSGNDTVLEKGMMVLIDSGAKLHGYTSDITRTFWIPHGKNQDEEELDKVWQLVKDAQLAALNATRPGMTPASVDKSARHVIEKGGYGKYFTHRLGHGIGLEGHEEPYLNSGNTGQVLYSGMTFTNEPGVYVEGSFGIRLEDMVLVTESGYELLSGGLAESPEKP
ncbi:hypothetical protein BGW42_002357 [Actinomortierella wolfii]|nr:hypothetical protein BGW42_002357 [Actinomortierella wolfii]